MEQLTRSTYCRMASIWVGNPTVFLHMLPFACLPFLCRYLYAHQNYEMEREKMVHWTKISQSISKNNLSGFIGNPFEYIFNLNNI